jgi:ADP-ribose pyrophosphatase
MNTYTHQDCEIIKKEIVHPGFLRVARYTLRYKLFKGGWSDVVTNEVVERKSSVAILPYDPVLDRVILIEQFRPGCLGDSKTPWVIEIPAGEIEETEQPEAVAYREAQEEAGCEITKLKLIADFFVSPGGSNEYLHLYYGIVDANLIGGVHGLADENEDIRVLNISAQEAIDKLHRREIKTAPAVIGLTWLELQRKTGR